MHLTNDNAEPLSLIQALEKFNRKERYWLLRNALGENSARLAPEFRTKLASSTGLSIPADAWWAMDYHLDWLIGALYLHDRHPPGQVHANPARPKPLVRGTQEDVDLLVAFANTLILIEAKADGAWSSKQLLRKMQRLEQILALPEARDITLRYVLTSPQRPLQLSRETDGRRQRITDWPEWMRAQDRDDAPLYQPLEICSDSPFQRITRCTKDGHSSATGEYWIGL